MLSDELREAMRTVDFEIRRGTCTAAMWELFTQRVDDIADRLESYERAAGPGPASRGQIPPGGNVVVLRSEPSA